jgi:hypothetical protein
LLSLSPLHIGRESNDGRKGWRHCTTGGGMTTTGSTDKADIARAMAMAVAELRRYGGTEAEVKALSEQFKTLADDEDAKLTDKQIPD